MEQGIGLKRTSRLFFARIQLEMREGRHTFSHANLVECMPAKQGGVILEAPGRNLQGLEPTRLPGASAYFGRQLSRGINHILCAGSERFSEERNEVRQRVNDSKKVQPLERS